MAPCTGTPDRQVVQERRPLARVGIMTVAATRCSPTSAVVVAVFAPERRGGTNEMAVSDTAVDTNRCAGRALQRERAAAMTMPTTEKTPVTTANPANGIVSPPSGTSKSTPTAWASAAARVLATIATSVAMKPVTTSLWGRWVLLFRPDVRPATTPLSFMLFMSFLTIRQLAYGRVDGRRRSRTRTGPAIAQVQLQPIAGDDVERVVPLPHDHRDTRACEQRERPHRDYCVSSAGRYLGSPSCGNWSAWNVMISVIDPSVMRRTSMVSGR
jgi:hypothetical protein